MNYWLVKSEPSEFSFADLTREKRTLWTGVRNFQARNFLREMAQGDQVLFYHSNCNPPLVAGLAVVTKAAGPDPSQFDRNAKYYDSRSTEEKPLWFSPEIGYQRALKNVTLEQLKNCTALKGLSLLQKGSRLSVHKLSQEHFEVIIKLAK